MPTRRDVHWNLIKQKHNFLPEYVITYGMTDKLWHKKFSFRDNFYSLLCIQLISIVFFRSVQIVFTSQFCFRHIFFGELFTFFYVWIWKLQKYKEFFFIQINFFLKLFHLGHSQIQYGYQNRLVYADIFFR